MFRFVVALAVAALAPGGAQAQERPAEQPRPAEQSRPSSSAAGPIPLDKGSYAVGFSFGSGLRKRKVELITEQVIAGMRDALTGQEARIGEEEVVVLNRQIMNAAMQRMQQETEALMAKNRAEGAAFLAANKGRPGVVTLPSGLQYQVLRATDGPKPAPDDRVHVHYRGTTIDGSPVHSSDQLRSPDAVLSPEGSMPGWAEALPMMSVGAKWKLWIPAELGFEKLAMGAPNIPPGATLVYELELVSIDPKPKAAAAPKSESEKQ